eukprot:362559-Chlamydomonas_euryale.AAC.6
MHMQTFSLSLLALNPVRDGASSSKSTTAATRIPRVGRARAAAQAAQSRACWMVGGDWSGPRPGQSSPFSPNHLVPKVAGPFSPNRLALNLAGLLRPDQLALNPAGPGGDGAATSVVLPTLWAGLLD